MIKLASAMLWVHDQDEAYFSFDDSSAVGTIVNTCGGPCVITPVPVP